MLRDVFFRTITPTAYPYKIILAEAADPLTTEAGYNDLFLFESDIAQIVGLILLFVESAGSIAELGAFAALGSVAPSILAVLSDLYYEQSSFIKRGPILFLEKKYGEEWILSLDHNEVGIADDGSILGLNVKAFMDNVVPAVEKRLQARNNWSKVDTTNNGHCILCMTGLCQEYGALTVTEIKEYLEFLGFIDARVSNYLYCAQLLGWLRKIRKGNNIYYAATGGDNALDFTLNGSGHDKIRLRSDIRAYWRDNERPRHNAIADVIKLLP